MGLLTSELQCCSPALQHTPASAQSTGPCARPSGTAAAPAKAQPPFQPPRLTPALPCPTARPPLPARGEDKKAAKRRKRTVCDPGLFPKKAVRFSDLRFDLSVAGAEEEPGSLSAWLTTARGAAPGSDHYLVPRGEYGFRALDMQVRVGVAGVGRGAVRGSALRCACWSRLQAAAALHAGTGWRACFGAGSSCVLSMLWSWQQLHALELVAAGCMLAAGPSVHAGCMLQPPTAAHGGTLTAPANPLHPHPLPAHCRRAPPW